MSMSETRLPESRYFSPGPTLEAALRIYRHIAALPLLCPHGHIDPGLFTGASTLGSPVDLLIRSDHYIFRMLYSQGIPLESLGLEPVTKGNGPSPESDTRKIWQVFVDNFHLLRGTPSGMWLNYELRLVLGIAYPLTSENAQAVYDQIGERLASPEFEPRRLYERFNIEALCTTDAADDELTAHKTIRGSGWSGRILPTFRPDALLNLDTPNWLEHLRSLERVTNAEITTYQDFVGALENRRHFFIENGAVSSDHAILHLDTTSLTKTEAEAIFQRALRKDLAPRDAPAFSAHMLGEMARMSIEDGLVMQIHPGSWRNHNLSLFERFGWDKGADIPIQGEFTGAMRPLLERFGNDNRLTIILFTLDESTYSRELAPLAGHYPCVKLGPPWWFHDSWNGMRRYFDQVMETAGIYNTCGFNDDTRAFLSIPARHDLWRRASAEWLSGLLVRHIITEQEAMDMAWQLSYGLAVKAYKL